MKPSFSTQLWVAIKIWLLAVIANTIIGSLYLTGFSNESSILGSLIILGALFGAYYSFPVLVVLTIIINRCVVKKINGLWIFRIVFISGLLATAGVWTMFNIETTAAGKKDMGLILISLLAGMIGVSLQYKSLYKLGEKDNELESFLEKVPNGE